MLEIVTPLKTQHLEMNLKLVLYQFVTRLKTQHLETHLKLFLFGIICPRLTWERIKNCLYIHSAFKTWTSNIIEWMLSLGVRFWIQLHNVTTVWNTGETGDIFTCFKWNIKGGHVSSSGVQNSIHSIKWWACNCFFHQQGFKGQRGFHEIWVKPCFQFYLK